MQASETRKLQLLLRLLGSEKYEKFVKADKAIIALSAIVVVLKKSQIHLDKISVIGSELSFSEPSVIIGVLGVVIFYLGLAQVRMGLLYKFFCAVSDEDVDAIVAKISEDAKTRRQFIIVNYFVITMYRLELAFGTYALLLARHDMVLLIKKAF